MHSTYPQMGHYDLSLPQMGAGPKYITNYFPQMGYQAEGMGHFQPQLGTIVYSEASQYGQMGDLQQSGQMGDLQQSGQMGASFDVGSVVSDALTKAFGVLPEALKQNILASPLGQQVAQQTSQVAYQIGADQAAAQAASFWSQREQALTQQFSGLLAYTSANYKKILTYAGIGIAAIAGLYFGLPLVMDLVKGKPTVAANPRRCRRK